MSRWNLKDGIWVLQPAEDDFLSAIRKPYREIFGRDLSAKGSDSRVKRLNLLLVDEQDELVAWHFGNWKNAETYYMANSCVLPMHRGKGIYGQFVQFLCERLRGLGAAQIESRHKLENNSVVFPKLSRGFQIQGYRVDARFGPLVELVKRM